MQGNPSAKRFFGFTSYEWVVLFAAWLGWGFDIFDALLFNYVARLCIPSLLGPGNDSPQIITWWTGALTSTLLVGWALGGIFFGKLTDSLGRSKTLLITMLMYALSTAACAFAPNIETLIFFRFLASLGIGGEWAAGAALVAETVPEKKRVQAGALLYTAAPAGLFLATFVTDLFTRQLDSIAANPDLAWRAVFLTGLVPAAVAIGVRLAVKEPERWHAETSKPRLAEIFSPQYLHLTLGGLAMAVIALVTWWSCNAFLPTIMSFLVSDIHPQPVGAELAEVKARLITQGTTWFNFGGLVGTLLTVPIAERFGRRPMYFAYFALSAAAIWFSFRLDLTPEHRVMAMGLIGLTVFGVFGSFTFYLPELFPTRLRGTGSGFCYNTGRLITAFGPFIVGNIAGSATTSREILNTVSWVAVVPLIGILLLLVGLGQETRGKALE